jgi:DNA polymerase III alpha subunit
LRAGLSIKGMGKEAETIVKNQPYSSVQDFLERTKIGKGRVESLIFSGAFDSFDTRENLYNWYHNIWLGEGKKVDTFDFFDDEESSFDNYRKFSEQELKEKELDINGYLIPKNIMVEFGKHIGTKLYNLTVKDILTVKRDNSHYPLVLGMIDGVRISKSRNGKEWAYLSLTDGFNELTVMTSKAKYLTRQKSLKNGNVVILPVAFSFDDDGTPKDRNTCFLSDEKNEIKVIKNAQ